MSLVDNLWRFRTSLRAALVALVTCVIAFTLYSVERDSLRNANEQRRQSLALVQELRQSSDDLTRMVRTYVATGDRRYRDYFEEIAAIRDGRSPRPRQYENVYWDLVQDERRPTEMGPAVALMQRMMESGFTDEELNRLAGSKVNSDTLVAIEEQAMALVESPDGDLQRNRLDAVRMLHDAAYHRAKADIMRPIAEVTRLVDERTASVMAGIEGHIQQLLAVFVVAVGVALGMLWLINRNLRLVLGGSVQQLGHAVMRAADNEGDTATGNVERDSVIGKLFEMQQVRVNAEGRRKDSERALSEAERQFRAMASGLAEGVCVVQDALIRFANTRMAEILEQSERELIDRPFIQFVHADDRAALMERYRKRVEGVGIDPTTELRVTAGSGGQRRILVRASHFEWSGRPATLYFISSLEERHAS